MRPTVRAIATSLSLAALLTGCVLEAPTATVEDPLKRLSAADRPTGAAAAWLLSDGEGQSRGLATLPRCLR
jgi:hypothetical protein